MRLNTIVVADEVKFLDRLKTDTNPTENQQYYDFILGGDLMHYLKHVLIDLEEQGIDYQNLDKDELVSEVLLFANDYLLDFQDEWYDWKNDDAGRWLDEYPDSCLTGKFHKDEFLEVIKKKQYDAVDDIDRYLLMIDDLPGLIEKEDNSIKITIDKEKIKTFCSGSYNISIYGLERIVSKLACNLDYDSILVNTIENLSIITPKLFEKIINNPERYAIALIDVHF